MEEDLDVEDLGTNPLQRRKEQVHPCTGKCVQEEEEAATSSVEPVYCENKRNPAHSSLAVSDCKIYKQNMSLVFSIAGNRIMVTHQLSHGAP